MPALGIVADDFTGALLIAGLLETAGVPCPVAFATSALRPAETAAVLVLAARTRLALVTQAMEELVAGAVALETAGCARLAYKACATFDSTPAGNIGPAADLLARRTGRPVLLSAGFPAYGVAVFQGHLFYRGTLVSNSIKRNDPLTPMNDPDLIRFLSRQTEIPLRLLPHAVLVRGVDAALDAWRALQSSGGGHVLADTADDGDVATTAVLADRTGSTIVASDPLIVAYARRLAAAHPVTDARPLPRHESGPAAVLAGSVGPVVLGQLARFAAEHPVLTLDLLDERPEGAVIEDTLAWAAPRLGVAPVAIATSAGPEVVARTQAALGAMGAAQKAERLLAAVAAGLLERGVRRFIVAGGETSGAVVAALGVQRARALPEGPLGCGFCISEGPEPLSLFLKSGKLGSEDVLLRAVEAMRA